jgi:two-component system cell cycle sensor histidine kinase/response regulator CckA
MPARDAPPARRVVDSSVGATDLPSLTRSDDALARLARVACRLLGTPMAVVSLADGGCHRVVASHGVAAASGGGDLPPVPALAGGRAVAVDDVRSADPAHRSVAAGLGAAAWAGAPITDAGGALLGSIWVLAPAPRRWTPDDLSALGDLAGVAAGEAARRAGAGRGWMDRLLESDIIGIMVAEDDVVVGANDCFLRMVGYTGQDVAAGRLRWSEITPPEYAEADARARAELLRHGGCAPYEKEYIRKDGTRVPVLIGSARLNQSPPRRVSFVLDLTERKALETRLRQAQRIESIAQLAGGVAHDFNNLLTAIIGSAELLLDEESLGAEGREDVEQIRTAANRAAHLTHQLLALSRRQVLQPRVLDLNAALDDIRRILRRLLGEQVELQIRLEPGLDLVLADMSQLEQVIVELALRARDAMPGSGRLLLSTANQLVDGSFAAGRPGLRPGRYAVLRVHDSGPSLDRGTLERIFEPFARGTGRADSGLSLASAYGIVKQSGGYLEVQSEPDRGTTFTIYLPAVDQPAREGEPVSRPDPSRPGETILLVEDEEQVRRLARRVLERHGYTVVTAPDAPSAVALANRHPGTIHLLVADMMLPGLSGRELAAQLAIHRPGVKVLYISGTTDNAIDRHRVLAPGTEFLQKPFALDQLVRKVRKVLDAPQTRS